MIDSHVILAMPFNFILRSSHLYYRNTQFLVWQCHLILVVYHTMYIVLYDLNKLTFLYIHVHISLLLL